MKIKLPLFCLLFLASYSFVFAIEPSAELRAKVNYADLIVIAKPVKINEVERIDFQRSDFKVKTPVWQCEKSVVPSLPLPLDNDSSRQAKTDGIVQWECCGEKKKIEIEDDGENVNMTTTNSKSCATFDSPTGYLTGDFGRYYDISLNGKKLSEDEYMNYELKQRQKSGRPKFLKKEITLKVTRMIKGEGGFADIIIDTEKGEKGENEIGSDYDYGFREDDSNKRILFLCKLQNGHYSLANYLAARNSTDMAIKDGFVNSSLDEGASDVRVTVSTNFSQDSPKSIPAILPEKMSLDDYVAMINTIMQEPLVIRR
jgi:hypothetical protein